MRIVRKNIKVIALLCLFNFGGQIFIPSVMALTGRDAMPDYEVFEPANTSNMVNLFDGSFTYNLPLLDVPGGYPINLSYHSNAVTNEAQATWVGLGWSLNPGAINRTKRGFADEFEGQDVKYHNKAEPFWSMSGGKDIGFELFGKKIGQEYGGDIAFNNYTGFRPSVHSSKSYDLGLVSGSANLELSQSGPSYSVGFALNLNSKPTVTTKVQESEGNVSDSPGLQKLILTSNSTKNNMSFGFNASTPRPLPTTVTKTIGSNIGFYLKQGVNGFPLHAEIYGGADFSVAFRRNKSQEVKSVFGYTKSEKANDNKEALLDYEVVNEKSFEVRDKHLGYPVPNYDVFHVSAQGMGGSFRAFRRDLGNYRKGEVRSDNYAVNGGYNATSPINPFPLYIHSVSTVGFNVGGTYSYSKVGKWSEKSLSGIRGNSDGFDFRQKGDFNESDENVLFRFSGDLAGSVSNHPSGEHPVDAGLVYLNTHGLSYGSDFGSGLNDTRVRRNSHISLNTFEDVNTEEEKLYKGFHKSLKVLDRTNGYDLVDIENLTGEDKNYKEISTVNSSGMRYTYGLPLRSRYEKNIHVSVKKTERSNDELRILSDKLSDFEIDKAKRIQGVESDAPYTSQFLLTEITSPDYIDRNFDGPTPDDFGSYTKFNYEKVAGGSDWYKSRTPFSGLTYSPGSFSVARDDMGSVSYSEREMYYVRSIASKTHVAVFTTEDREDGFGATNISNGSVSSDNNDHLGELVKADGSTGKKLKALKKIDLYGLKDCEDKGHGFFEPRTDAAPIKTVHFEYSYELCPGSDNSNSVEKGKLTLKKVWFEYGGKIRSKTAPYLFKYNYPDLNAYQNTAYSGTLDAHYNLTSAEENPDYELRNTDRWGYYRSFDYLKEVVGDKLALFFPFNSQAEIETKKYDPAAYCLKQITLPSGGEIHVQYEQNDYYYVQDKKAKVMLPLLENSSFDREEKNIDDKKYYIDMSALQSIDGQKFSTLTNPKKKEVLDQIFAFAGEERMYFNFLYTLIGDDLADYNSTNAEYIEGFATIAGYGMESGKPYVSFGFKKEQFTGAGEYSFFEPVNSKKDKNRRELPKKVCKEFYENMRQGIAGVSLDDIEEPKDIWDFIISRSPVNIGNVCKSINPAMSYIRVNAYSKKKAGGVRVKRLLMYDKGVGSIGVPSLYGSEYDYTKYETNQKIKTISSGVATTEPYSGNYENALVLPLPLDEQKTFNSLLYGKDLYGQLGPLGQTVMPAPSVGYSQVTIRNIHKGETGGGKEIYKYFTYKDHPFVAKETTMDKRNGFPLSIGGKQENSTTTVNSESPKENIKKNSFGVSYNRTSKLLSKGYSFIDSKMHGVMKSVEQYDNENDGGSLITGVNYEYYHPGEQVEVFNGNAQVLGMESELLTEQTQVSNVSVNTSVSRNNSVGTFTILVMAPPLTIPSAMSTSTKSKVIKKTTTTDETKATSVSVGLNESYLRTSATTKITTYTPILKKQTAISDGIVSITEYSVFDHNTGEPIVVKTYDEFEKTITGQSIKAHWIYPEMGQIGQNEGIISGAVETGELNGKEFIRFTSSSECGEAAKYTAGDFIQLKNGDSKLHLYHISEVDAENDIVYISKSALNTGTELASTYNNVEIIKSGYTNELGVNAGNITTYGDDYASEMSGVILNFDGKSTLSDGLQNALNNYVITHPSLEDGIIEFDVNSGNVSFPENDDLCFNTSCVKSEKYKFSVKFENEQIRLTLITFNFESEHKKAIHLSPNFIEIKFAQGGGANVGSASNWRINCTLDGNTCFDCNNTLGNIDGSQSSFFDANNPQKTEEEVKECYKYQASAHIVSFGHPLLENQNYTPDCPYCGIIKMSIPYGVNDFTNLSSSWDLATGFGVFKTTKSGIVKFCKNSEGCCSQGYALENITICVDENETEQVETNEHENVLSASASTFSDDWTYDETYFQNLATLNLSSTYHGTANEYEKGFKGRWRSQRAYAYRKNASQGLNYENGTFTLDLFNWDKEEANDPNRWVLTNEVTKYNANGYAIEDRNILDVYSTSTYGYNQTLPILVAQNAEEGSVYYESFENYYDINGHEVDPLSSGNKYLEYGDGPYTSTFVSTKGHTGSYAHMIEPFGGNPIAKITLTDQIKDEGLMVRVWVYQVQGTKPIEDNIVCKVGGLDFRPLSRISHAGEWQLFELIVPKEDLTSMSTEKIDVTFSIVPGSQNLNIALGNVLIDDIRIQPLQSEMMTYVYDRQQRLVASFDDQHYALIYEYNAEGQLIRKLKETERGVKTISETQYNVTGENR